MRHCLAASKIVGDYAVNLLSSVFSTESPEGRVLWSSAASRVVASEIQSAQLSAFPVAAKDHRTCL